jgi:hypothetical protein
MKHYVAASILLAAVISAPETNAATGFLKGESKTNFNKVCIYDVLGSAHTINISSVALCPLTINVDSPAKPPANQGNSMYGPQKNARLVGEKTSGMNKVCIYDYLGDELAYTVSSVSLCPLTRKF